jgi:hypothetical protein
MRLWRRNELDHAEQGPATRAKGTRKLCIGSYVAFGALVVAVLGEFSGQGHVLLVGCARY